MSTADSNDDLFQALYAEELKIVQNGYNEGFLKGQKSGLVEGESLGKNQGSKVGQELGYYFGFCQAYLFQIDNNHTLSKSEQKAISLFKEIVATIEKINKFEPIILKNVIKIRSQFKQASTILKLNKDVSANYRTSDPTSF